MPVPKFRSRTSQNLEQNHTLIQQTLIIPSFLTCSVPQCNANDPPSPSQCKGSLSLTSRLATQRLCLSIPQYKGTNNCVNSATQFRVRNWGTPSCRHHAIVRSQQLLANLLSCRHRAIPPSLSQYKDSLSLSQHKHCKRGKFTEGEDPRQFES